MFINPARASLGLLFLLPIAAAIPNPTPPPDFGLGSLNLYNRAAVIVGGGVGDPITDSLSHSSSPTSSSTTTTTPDVSPPPDVITTTSTTPTSTTSTTTSSPTAPPSSAPPLSTTSQSLTTNQDGVVLTMTVVVSAQTSTAPTTTPATDSTSSSSGPGQGTYIGVGVAGGIALLGLIAFIVWKFNQKRFSQLDDDAGDINWPMPKEAVLQAPVAPNMAATNATTSSIDLSHDPYAVPPLPPSRAGPYYDDPSGSGVFYDPYRGPVPQTFASPPASTEGHPAYPGEAIPMSTYASNNGRQSPGPNDPYARSASPGPTVAYGDPYARTRSPGPAVAYEDPYAGRRSPGPSLAYGAPGPYDPMARMGTPVRGGTPVGTGYAGAVPPPGLDIMRTGTPGSYRGPSPAPPGAQPYGIQHQPGMQDPYGGYAQGAYGR